MSAIMSALSRFLPLLAVATVAQAQEVSVREPWVRATVPGMSATGAFMSLQSAREASVVGAASPVAEKVELHRMVLEGGVMKMRALESLPLPAGKAVKLVPGGYHVMLMGLKKPLAAGDSVPIRLDIREADGSLRTLEIQAPVRPLAGPAPAASHEHSGHAAH